MVFLQALLQSGQLQSLGGIFDLLDEASLQGKHLLVFGCSFIVHRKEASPVVAG